MHPIIEPGHGGRSDEITKPSNMITRIDMVSGVGGQITTERDIKQYRTEGQNGQES